MLYKMIVIAGAMFALFGAAVLGGGKGDEVSKTEGEKVRDSRFGACLTTDKALYTVGQPVNIEFCIFNRTGQEITLHYRDAQRYDFILEDDEGKEVWRWSDGRMFSQVLGEEKLGTGREEIIYAVKYQGKIKPGKYRITGSIQSIECPMTASLTIEVK